MVLCPQSNFHSRKLQYRHHWSHTHLDMSNQRMFHLERDQSHLGLSPPHHHLLELGRDMVNLLSKWWNKKHINEVDVSLIIPKGIESNGCSGRLAGVQLSTKSGILAYCILLDLSVRFADRGLGGGGGGRNCTLGWNDQIDIYIPIWVMKAQLTYLGIYLKNW